ncbi:DUF3426 domain-containing protein [Marinobacter vulgaris]|uniref:DUF3426 domain-containing protein n=1 Tax=Marinobacter vulgaris TaxID=1928331 RepID=A0A2V3ZQ79_9GAMM|nr:DUF3426 domain-containing protein [Marinobacter vulgaris]PXX93489.1 DUF3426 domain-containing protein [Marinobacter vulgaris]TSJ72497.1 DUF3426 domain-containing protein [Marinobacter vulgaris]
MTQSSLQTRCPKCETRFRVTDAQLGVAGGKVRCGNCMAVFNAVEHQVGDSTSSATSDPSKAPANQDEPADQRFTSEDDLIFADNPEEDAAEGPYAGTKLTFSDDELSDSFRSVDECKSSSFESEGDENQEKIDESWAEAMLSDDDSSPGPESATPGPAEHTQAEAPAQRKPDRSPPREDPSLEPTDEPEEFYVDQPQSSSFDYDSGPVSDNEPITASSPYTDLRREPVSVGGNGGGRLRTALWTLVVLALIGVLVAQVTWFQFDRLSSIPELRPFYEQACEISGCELKPLINVDAIQSRKLVVRTNPEDRSQLVVDAVIINRASFEQPFPAIALTFSNLNGDVVAQSVFTPEEYLAGEGQGMEAMPTDTPVRIMINIRDPGRDAVNYNIAFRANPE